MTRSVFLGLPLALSILVAGCNQPPPTPPLPFTAKGTARGPTWNSPIAITSDNKEVWVVSPDTNEVAVLNVAGDANVKVTSITVGKEPRSVSLTQDDARAYVVNQFDGTVTVIDVKSRQVITTIKVGTEPFGAALTPNGTRLYVANTYSNNVSVVDTGTNSVAATVTLRDNQPRAIAITNDGDTDDGDETVYATHFLAFLKAGGTHTKDTDYEARVAVISATSVTQTGTATLSAIANTGFINSGAFPNALDSVAIKGSTVFVPGTGTSPTASNNSLNFRQNVHAVMTGIKAGTTQAAFSTATLNTPSGFGNPGDTILAIHVPLGIAFKNSADEGYVVSSGSNFLAHFSIGSDGTPTLDTTTGPINVGDNPRGIAINSTDTRAYVMNYVSRDVSVVDLTASPNKEAGRILVATPDASTAGQGKKLFFASVRGTPNDNTLSKNGWGSCAGCHPGNGLMDGVVWQFVTGPRKVIPLNQTFDSGKIRVLNFSAVRDEVQDFELNIRNVSSGSGLIKDGQPVVNLVTDTTGKTIAGPIKSSGRSSDLDALAEFIRTGIRTPRSPVSTSAVLQGRALFEQAKCTSCHSGANWSGPLVTYSPPPVLAGTNTPDPAIVSNTANPGITFGFGQIKGALFQVGTFVSGNPIEIRATGAKALGEGGFNPPSLLGAHAFPPYFHDGSAATLEATLENETHRRAGNPSPAPDVLSDPTARKAVVEFVRSIDSNTVPFTRP